MQTEATPQIRKEDIQHILEKNGLGLLRYLKPISKGVESSTYSLITEKETFVLTLFDADYVDLSNLKEITNHFCGMGFPFAQILATTYIQTRPALLSTHLPGKVKINLDESDYREIGFFLGNFHKCSDFYKPTNQSLPFIWQFSDIFYEIKSNIPNEFHKLEQEIFFLEEKWPHELPKGIIHGDIWPKNILFQEDSISGVLDFNPTYDPYIIDLANILKGIPKDKTPLQESLIRGYELARPLTTVEFESLDVVIYAKMLASILYLLEKSILFPKRRDQFQTYALLNLLKLDLL
jgi:homoserine kinase type II